MATFDFNSINSALTDTSRLETGVDFSGKSLKLDTEKDAQPIIDAINACPDLQYLTLTGNTLGVAAAQAIAKALEHHPELKIARFSDMFTGRMKTEIPPALSALGEGMITAGARLSVLELSDNAFGPIGVQGLAKLLQSDVCSQLQELRLNNNGLGITGGRLLAEALSASPRKLKVFIAGRNRLENDGATALARVFQGMGTLEEIAMPQNGIYHKGVSALSEAFKHNPNLSCLNLNDNTIGSKGAEAIATVLPGLKKLKSINFGDCLLKSKGAKALAKAFKDNSLLLESVDLSHNEIGREACIEVVDAVTALPDSTDRLSRVVLAGNSLGDSTNKKTMKDKLGSSAELSDGEGSDEEYVSGSESDGESDGSDDENTEDSAPEDAQHVIKDPSDLITAYVEATFSVSGLSDESQLAHQVALDLYPIMLKRAGQQHASAWLLANTMLRGLGLIKSENKQYRIRWKTSGCYRMLAIAVTSPTFPIPLKDTLKFFIASRLTSLADRTIVEQHPQLYLS
ncbi:Ran GTPase-activating protein 1 [Papilio machaon]|uniref:Ran GTPase-activating protein 1 n=1 Tax=Papilio machaon TaxID=76193 RepID=A0A0N1IG59_PAPMA|nr:Ran GTPase-activating protein 1 [Papilio machaon]